MYHGSEKISFLRPKIWNILQDRLKNGNSKEALKMQIKNGSLKIAHVAFARFMFKMSVLLKSYSRNFMYIFMFNLQFSFFQHLEVDVVN